MSIVAICDGSCYRNGQHATFIREVRNTRLWLVAFDEHTKRFVWSENWKRAARAKMTQRAA